MKQIKIVFLFTLIGCQQNVQHSSTELWFDLPVFIHELTQNMADRRPRVVKTFALNNISESQNYISTDTAFWRKELAILAKIDLNSAQFRDIIEFTGSTGDELSNLLIDEFRILGAKESALQKVRIYYLGQPLEIRQIQIEMCKSNLIADSEKSIKLWVNRYNNKLLIDSIKVNGKDKTLLRPTREYLSITNTLW